MTVSELLLEQDRQRPRSLQRELGMSDLGGCRRRAGYRLAGTEPTNPGGSVQAVMGVAIHKALEDALRATAGPDDLIEHEVKFAGITGHIDFYDAAAELLADLKTTSSLALARIKSHGPYRSHLYQTHAYAAALISEGRPVKNVRIVYLARDTGEEFVWTTLFRPELVEEALDWLRQVRDAELDMLPRDYEPDSSFCRGCPYYQTCWDGGIPGRDPRTVLIVERPEDAPKYAEQLQEARRLKEQADALEAEAKGALEALRPEDPNVMVDIGWDRLLRWQHVRGRRTLDQAAVLADYEATGATPPYKVGEPSYRLQFVDPAVAS